MKTFLINKTAVESFISITCFLTLLVMLSTGCKKNLIEQDSNHLPADVMLSETSDNPFTALSIPPLHPYNAELSRFSRNLPPDELIVWLKPGRTYKEFLTWRKKLIDKTKGQVNVNRLCGSCDSSLMLLKGTGVQTFIQGQTVSGGQSSSPPVKVPATGDEGLLYHCRNFRVSFSRPRMAYSTQVIPPNNVIYSRSERVKTAIFDTGLQPGELTSYLYMSLVNSCMPQGERGWNFVMRNNMPSDDDPVRHGSTVTRFITDEVIKAKRNRIEILPGKTHDANGMCDLYVILCAFAYAKQMGVKVINGSFGFYLPRLELHGYPEDPNVLLLKKYVKHYLTANKILLITAAGNADDANEQKTFQEHGLPYTSAPRNLDSVNFFPASLARDPSFSNVIAVTTVYNGVVSPMQNFSPNVVDMGVEADGKMGNHMLFNNPRYNANETVEGSSFATPIVTGKLCANYDRFSSVLNPVTFNKSAIWNSLGSIVTTNATLTNKIKGGRVMKRL